MNKQIVGIITAVIMIFAAIPTGAVSMQDLYSSFSAEYPEFLEAMLSRGASEELIIDFFIALRVRLNNKNKTMPLTEENFEGIAVDAVIDVGSADKFSPLVDALYSAYPSAALKTFMTRKVADELRPIYNILWDMVFEYDMLSSDYYCTIKRVSSEDGSAAEFTVIKTRDNGKLETLIIAFYDRNNMIVGLTTEKMPLETNNTYTINAPVPDGAAKVSGFVWDGLADIQPLADAEAAILK
ncbi:MAG: hypothetical protein ACI4SS_06350 [Clostridia bacterium]